MRLRVYGERHVCIDHLINELPHCDVPPPAQLCACLGGIACHGALRTAIPLLSCDELVRTDYSATPEMSLEMHAGDGGRMANTQLIVGCDAVHDASMGITSISSRLTSSGLKKSAQMVTRILPARGPCASTPTSSMPLGPSQRMGRPTRSKASSTNCLHAGAGLTACQDRRGNGAQHASTPTSCTPLGSSHRLAGQSNRNARSTSCLHASALLRA